MVRFLRGGKLVEADPIAGELHALAALERRLGLHRPRLGARHAERHDENAEVHDEAAIAAVLGDEEATRGGQPPPRGAPAGADGPIEVEDDGAADEDHEPHAQEDEGIADAEEAENAGATMPAITGFRKFRRRLSADARRHAMSGPTPIMKSKARKTGMFTRLKKGAPTLTLTPRTASESSGKTVPKKTVKVAARSKTLLSRKADSRETTESSSPCPRRRSKRHARSAKRAQEHEGKEPKEELADRALAEGVDGSDDPRAREEGAEQGEAEGQDDQGEVPELEHPPPLLDHHRVEERRGGEPWHERRVLDGIPGPVPAPAEHVIAPPAADQEPERQEVPCDDGPASRDRDPLIARPARDEGRHGERERHREAREAQVERHGVGDHARSPRGAG